LEEMETNKVVEEVPPEEMHSMTRVFYMPHRPVVKETSASTKVRPVFDASAKDGNGLSLNDCFATGPNCFGSRHTEGLLTDWNQERRSGRA